jgi:hypothetical protein
METDRRTANIDRDALQLIFNRVGFTFGLDQHLLTLISYMRRYLEGVKTTSTMPNVNNVALLITSGLSSSIWSLQ